MAEADLEDRDGQGPVESGVRRHGDDHVTIPQRLRAVCAMNHFALAQRPASATVSAATRLDDATSRFPSYTSTCPSRSPFAIGRARALGATTRSTSGRPTLMVRRDASRRNELDVRLPVAGLRGRIDARRVDHLHLVILVEPVRKQLFQRLVALAPRPAAEDGAVHGRTAPFRTGSLRPPGIARVTGLPGDKRRPGLEQVVGAGKRAAAGERHARTLEGGADERDAERVANELGHVARARDVSALVQAVRVLEVRVGQAELCCLRIHQLDETIGRSAPDVKGECLGRVIRARDQHRAHELANGQLLTRAQVHGRLADARCP